MYRTKSLIGTLVVVLLASLTGPALAQDEPAAEESEQAKGPEQGATPLPAIYLPIKPAFVVNYGGAGRLRYLKTELSVRLQNSDVANSIRHHLPYIRNNLMMLFARQTDESLSSQEGKEALRHEVLEEIRKIVRQEDGQEGVIDVYFDTFIVQK